MHGVPVARGETESLTKEPLRVFDQFVCSGSLQTKFGQFASLNGSFEVGLHISNARLEISDGSRRVAVAFKFGEMAPMPFLGSFAI